MAVENLEFLNANTLRAYPIKEGMTRVSAEGVTIPDNFLVDCSFAISSDVTARIYISKINNLGDQIEVLFSDQSDVLIGNIIITPATHTLYQTYPLLPSVAYANAIGRITVASVAAWTTLPAGSFTYTLATAELEARTVVPAQRGINRIVFKNADGTTFSASGNVIVESRVNMKFTYNSGTNTILMDAGEGLGLNTICAPQDQPIKTINGISPDVNGNFILDFASCALVTVLPSNTGILLNDICCKPCIGCEEMGTLTDRLITLESNLIALREYYTSLLQAFDNYKAATTLTCSCS